LELIEVSPGRTVFELEYRKELTQSGILHGGVLASIVDSACAVAAHTKIMSEGFITTINLQIEYLKPVSQGRIRAEGECIKTGKNIMFCKCKIWNEKGELVGTGSSQLLRINYPKAKW